jgi:pSer/pThr/pTyr-binding forkhead associated (FHA) protein
MVQFEILSGKTAGSWHAARRFPFAIGRAADSSLRIEEDGVWNHHAIVSLVPNRGFRVEASEKALLMVNDTPVSQSDLRNGDQLALGSARIRFWLSDARQRGLAWRELLVWGIVLAVFAAQFGVIFWLW